MNIIELLASLAAVMSVAAQQTLRLVVLRGGYSTFPVSAGYRKGLIAAASLLSCLQLAGWGVADSMVAIAFVALIAAFNALCSRMDQRFANAFMSLALLAQAGDMILGAWPQMQQWRLAFDAWSIVAALRLAWQLAPTA